MNIGNMILALRKQKNVTQEALAAELGVTAAAVSKWEKGYTLPDILMVCALADYFEVTTDELLRRSREKKYAVIAANSPELCKKIQHLAEQYGIIATAVFDNKEDAAAAIRENPEIDCLIIGLLGNQIPDLSYDLGGKPINLYLSLSNTEQDVLNNLRNSLSNNT